MLLALPGLGVAQTVSLTPNPAGSPQDFGSVPVGNTSASKAYITSGSNLVNNLIIAIPASFEGSTDNTTFSASSIMLVPDGSGNVPSTAIYLRFKPTTTGTVKLGFRATTDNASFTPINSSPPIVITGSGAPGSPKITVSPTALGFGNQVVNTQSGPMSVTVNGTSLTAAIAVTAPVGFQVSTDQVTYTSSASLTPTNGSVNTTVYVVFRPTAVQNYVDQVTFTSTNATAQNVSVSGTGILPTPVLTVNPATLPNFGSVVVGATGTTTATFTVTGQSLQGDVTVTPPAGFRIRTGANVFSTNAITLTPTNGTLASTSVDVRFTPIAAQTYSSAVSVTTPNSSGSTPVVTQSVAVSGTGTPTTGTPALNVSPSVLNFGAVTSSGSASTLTFDVSGTDLTADIVLTPSATSMVFRNASAGGAFSNSPLTLTRTNGTVATQTIEVKLVPTVLQGNYSERVDVTSGTAATLVKVKATNHSGAVSDISVSSPPTNDFTFVTRPNTVSASQAYLLAATNLLQTLVVAPTGPNAAYFQVSSDNVTFSSQLSFSPDAQGNVTQRPVYVRFVPNNNPVTVTANISNVSAPAPELDVSVTGISEPTIRLSRAIGTFPNYIVKGTHSDPVAVRVYGFLLSDKVDVRFPADADDPVRNPAQTPQYEFSLDNGATYVQMTTLTPDANGNFSKDLLVRFAPVRVGNAAQEMQFRNVNFSSGNYFVLASGFGRVSGFGIATKPTAQSTATVTRAAGGASATIVFNLASPPTGASYGQNRLVIASTTYSQLPTRLFPLNKSNFDPGTTDANNAHQFGTGTAIESSTSTYVVFSAASNNFTVSNLDPNLQYHFFAFEFNDDGVLNAENYLVPNNQALAPLPVELLAFAAQRHGQQVDLTWATASEKGSRSFEVQRSTDGIQFSALLSKAAQGSTSARTDYAATDHRPLPGLSYYRLKLIDLDGTVGYSPVVAVPGDGQVAIGIFPNPTTGKVTIRLPEGLAAAPRVRISDLMGRLVLEQVLPAAGEVDLGALPVGTYLVNVGGQQVHTRLVKY